MSEEVAPATDPHLSLEFGDVQARGLYIQSTEDNVFPEHSQLQCKCGGKPSGHACSTRLEPFDRTGLVDLIAFHHGKAVGQAIWWMFIQAPHSSEVCALIRDLWKDSIYD